MIIQQNTSKYQPLLDPQLKQWDCQLLPFIIGIKNLPMMGQMNQHQEIMNNLDRTE